MGFIENSNTFVCIQEQYGIVLVPKQRDYRIKNNNWLKDDAAVNEKRYFS